MDISTFRKSEQLSLELSKLYEQYGYCKFYMNKLEEYAFYVDNINFLQSRNIIVFSDLNGKLMALKPDITLSIVKNAKPDASGLDKLYYTENVFRAAKSAREYRELRQMGVECIGSVTPYTIVEMLTLAAKSLRVIDEEYALCISHLGMISGLLASTPADYSIKRQILRCIREKNPHDIVPLANAAGIDGETLNVLQTLASLSGEFSKTLDQARSLCINAEMEAAVLELALYQRALPADARINLDFSIVSDTAYYNGIILQGYVRGASNRVLSGGQYDNLLSRMGKQKQRAIGFAIYFDELERYEKLYTPPYDVLVLYGHTTDPADTAAAVEAAVSKGKRVLAETEPPEDAAYITVTDLRRQENA